MSDRYTFDHAQLHDLVHGAIELYLEYREQHAKADEDARAAVVREVFEALDSEGELVADGILPAPTLQTPAAPPPSAKPRRRRVGLYDYLMGVADTLSQVYGQHGTADTVRKIARPAMGIDPSIVELLDTDIDELGKDADE